MGLTQCDVAPLYLAQENEDAPYSESGCAQDRVRLQFVEDRLFVRETETQDSNPDKEA